MNLTLQSIPSTVITEALCDSFLDGVVLDTEHGYFNNETLFSCIQIATLMNKKCFVRFTYLDKTLIRMCLDADIDGIIFSTVESKKQAVKIIKYCNYPQHGGKRGCALVRENKWGDSPIGVKTPIIIAQIETKKGVDNINKIKELDFQFFLVGPYDLSASLGCVADWNNPLYKTYLNKIYSTIPIEQMGMFLPSVKDIKNFQEKDHPRPNLLIWGLDVDFIKHGINSIAI